MNISWLFAGWNVAFILPLLLALAYLGLYVASGMTFGDSNAGAEADSDANADVDADAHADAHVGVNHGPSDGLIHHHDGPPADPPAHVSVLHWFGVGRVPVSLWAAGLLLGWGVAGLAAASFARSRAVDPATALALQLAAGALGALVAARGLAVVVTRVVPLQETYAHRRHDLLGVEGEAIYAIDGTFGMAGVRNAEGVPFQVGCRVADDGPPIAKGGRVKLVAYDRDANLFHVVPAVPSASPTQEASARGASVAPPFE